MSTQLKFAEPTIHRTASDDSAARLARLTPAELEIARFVAEGFRNREIGVMLRMSEQTVKNYVSKIFEKVDVFSRVGLARIVLTADLDTGALDRFRELQQRPRSLRVLLAEDSKLIQRIAVRLLEDEGHRVTVVTTGREAVAMVERGGFDLVIMDLQMPEMDGLDATRAIRERERRTGSRIPIVALTADDRQPDQERCFAAGMDCYLAKPPQPCELVRILRELPLRSERTSGQGPERSTPAAGAASVGS